MAGADTPTGPAEGWSRQRGILAAVVAILVVVLTLLLSRLDLANELVVVRSQLSVANQELAENQQEIDDLEDAARGRSEDVAACRDLAELSKRLQSGLEILQRGLDSGSEGTVARGVARVLEEEQQWSEATDRCLEATQEAEG